MTTQQETAFLRNAFERFAPMDSAAWEVCQGLWQRFKFSRGQYLIEAGQVEKYLYVVESGVQRMSYCSAEGVEHTLGFSFAPSFSGAYDSLLYQRPSANSLEALSDSIVWGISYIHLMSLFDRFQCFERWGREFAQQILIGRGQREIELLTLSAHDRFKAFEQRSPKELLDIPQKYLASYLNMTAETFSRIRAKREE